MKISIIGPGIMPIPPKGWGAVEVLIWDYYTELTKLGHQVQIVNVQNNLEIIKQTNEFKPDFVHLQYDDYAHLLQYIDCPLKAATSHYGYIEQFQYHPEYHHILNNFINGDFLIFCLSEGIKNTYLKLGINPKRLFVTPNGARSDLFEYREEPLYPERSIYLAKIDYRKRQYIYQNINNLYFAGNCADGRFDIQKETYLGEWDKDYLYKNLTNYTNLVLLSDGEADPLVTKEALMAGLGLVISEYASANLDLNQPFIDIIPNSKINDIEYIKNIIFKNRQVSIQNRNNIRNYALANQTWNTIIDKYVNLIDALSTKNRI
jgi:glycosyltransferase involved in cell wall biosynthesis